MEKERSRDNPFEVSGLLTLRLLFELIFTRLLQEVVVALKKIFADEKLEKSIPLRKAEYQRMAKELISAENIRNKFEKTFVEYNPARN